MDKKENLRLNLSCSFANLHEEMAVTETNQRDLKAVSPSIRMICLRQFIPHDVYISEKRAHRIQPRSLGRLASYLLFSPPH